MAKDVLSQFASGLLEEADARKQEILKDLKLKHDKQISAAKERLAIKQDKDLRLGRAALIEQKRLSVERRELELRRALLEKRSRFFSFIFNEVTKNVRAFTQTPEYQEFLTAKFRDAVPYFGSGRTICTVMPCDMDTAKKLFKLDGIEFLASDEDFIGGFTLENAELRIFADCTLMTKIQDEKQRFTKTGSLIID